MKRLSNFLILFIYLLMTNYLQAQEEVKKEQEFKLSAEIRPRLEYYHGYKQLAAPDQNHGLSISQRTRLNFDFKNSNFLFKISIQDVRIWGEKDQLATNESYAFSIHEAWGEAIISQKFSIKVGRQEIMYDDYRIFGNVDWLQQGRSHDAALFKFKTEKFRAELAIAYNQDAVNLTGTDNVARNTNYKAIQNLWMNYKFSEQVNASFLFLNNGMQIETNGGDAYSQTIGTRVCFSKEPFNANIAAYYQGGTSSSLTDINANYLWADLNYSISEIFNIGIGFERLSGNSEIDNDNENNAFTPFYGTNHKFNGHMDYFYVGNHIGSVGLNDLFLQLSLKYPKWSFGLHSHYFASAGEIEDPVNPGYALDNYLGLEFDLFCDYKFSDGVAFKAGYSQMFAGESMEVVKGGDKDEMNNWAFLMITFKPILVEHKK